MTGRAWKPGDVGVYEPYKYRGIYVSKCPAHERDSCWHNESGFSDPGDQPRRPLLVIDPESADDRNRFRQAAINVIDGDWPVGEALRSLVTDPKPEEPTGLGAVVEATAYTSEIRTFVRTGNKKAPWADDGRNGHGWSELRDVRLLSPGYDPEADR